MLGQRIRTNDQAHLAGSSYLLNEQLNFIQRNGQYEIVAVLPLAVFEHLFEVASLDDVLLYGNSNLVALRVQLEQVFYEDQI